MVAECTNVHADKLGIDLTNLISKLDTTASDIVAHQRDSLVQRKDLAQKTKDFRRLDDAGKLGEYKGLLKGAQIHNFKTPVPPLTKSR